MMRRLQHLCLILFFLAACSRTQSESDLQATPTGNAGQEEEPAVQRFIASAPVAARSNANPTPTRIVLSPQLQGFPLPDVDPFVVTGDLRITGSPTLARLTEVMYKRFVKSGYYGTIKIEEIGTTPGFRRYCETGEADLMLAARPIQEAELRACMQQGRLPVALLIALNAIVVVVHPDNQFVENVNFNELATLFRVTCWSEVQPTWPEKAIVRFLPGTNFGAFSYFATTVFAGDAVTLQKASFTKLLSDQAEIVSEIAGNADGLGFIDYPVYALNQDMIKAVSINGFKPNQVTVAQRQYPLVNTLLIYTDAQTLHNKPQVASFLLFYLTYMYQELEAAGNFAVDSETMNRSKIILLTAMENEAYIRGMNQQLKATPSETPEVK